MMRFPNNSTECQDLTKTALQSMQKFQSILSEAPEDPTHSLLCLRDLDQCYYNAAKVANIMEIIKSVHPTNLRQQAAEQQYIINREIHKVNTDQRLYELMKRASTVAVNPEDQYYIEREMNQLKSNGFDLKGTNRERHTAISSRLEQLAQEFMVNLQKPVHITVSKEELNESGLDIKRLSPSLSPSSSSSSSPSSSSVKVHPGTYDYVMCNSKSRPLRQRMFKAWNQQAYEANNKIMDEFISLHTEQATLVGFTDAAAHQLWTESPQRTSILEDFYEHVTGKLAGTFEKEIELLRNHFNLEDDLTMYDIPYYIHQYRLSHNSDLDTKDYFQTGHTVQQVIKIYERFFDLDITLDENKKGWGLWHKDVNIYRVQTVDHVFLGYILTDLYPRKGKNPNCCMMRVGSHSSGGQNNDSATALVLANLPRKNLTHKAMLTFFHEFGHAIHQMLGDARWASVSGNVCAPDFLEFPSQLMEEWMWDREVLKFLASKPIPDDVLTNIIQSRTEFQANDLLRQAIMGQVSLRYFSDNANTLDARQGIWQELMDQYMPDVMYTECVDMTSRFYHLIAYGAKYYSYLWSRDKALMVKQLLELSQDQSNPPTTLLDFKAGRYKDVLMAGGGLSPTRLFGLLCITS